MKSSFIILIVLVSGIFFQTCKPQKSLVPSLVRTVKPDEVVRYHKPLNVRIAWYPYENQGLIKTGDDSYKIVKDDSAKTGAIPAILITYPDTQDSIWLDMGTRNETLGKLLKHSIMTQEPITRPFDKYLETASCTKCHPKNVEVDFDW